MLVVGSILVALAAILHGYIFLMESLWWRRPAIWRRFGVADQAQADATRPMAYNQGFYNLFLGIGAAIGLVLVWVGLEEAGRALVLFATACMALAALVLTTTGRGYWRAALVQGTLPTLGFVTFLFV